MQGVPRVCIVGKVYPGCVYPTMLPGWYTCSHTTLGVYALLLPGCICPPATRVGIPLCTSGGYPRCVPQGVFPARLMGEWAGFWSPATRSGA